MKVCSDCPEPTETPRSLRCSVCKRKKAVAAATSWRLNNVQRRREYERSYFAANPDRQRAKVAAWRDRNPDKVAAYKASLTADQQRNWYLRSAYGITLDDQRSMWARQGGCCCICMARLTDDTLAVDHNHETGEVRGLLCRTCNSALGAFEADPMRLLIAFSYLTATDRPWLAQQKEVS